MKFVKKPVVIDAVQYTGSVGEVLDWVKQVAGKIENLHFKYSVHDGFTLEGSMLVSPNDWIICGVKGEFYPCKPDIFEATYEPVGEKKLAFVEVMDATTCERAEKLMAQKLVHARKTDPLFVDFLQRVENRLAENFFGTYCDFELDASTVRAHLEMCMYLYRQNGWAVEFITNDEARTAFLIFRDPTNAAVAAEANQ